MTALLLLLIVVILLFGAAAVRATIVLAIGFVVMIGLLLVIPPQLYLAAALMIGIALTVGLGAFFWNRRRKSVVQWQQLLAGDWGGGPVDADQRAELRAIFDEQGILPAIDHHNRRN